MKKTFIILLALSFCLSYSVALADQPRESKIIKPARGTLGAAFSGIWEGTWIVKSGHMREAGKNTSIVVKEVKPPKIKGLYIVEGLPPEEIEGEITDAKTAVFRLNDGAEIFLHLVSDNKIQAEWSNTPGIPSKGK